MNSTSFIHPNYLFELISQSEYPEIRQLCLANRQTFQICTSNSLIRNIINRKRIKYKTDLFLDRLHSDFSNYTNEELLNRGIIDASDMGDVEIVDELIKRGVDPTASNNYAIRLASSGGHLAVVNRLLQDPRVDPTADDNLAIRFASSGGHLAVVNRLLQDPRVDPTADDNLAIQWASSNGHLAVVNRLLQHPDVDPTAGNNAAIRLASSNGHLAVVNRLLQHPDVDPTAGNNVAIRLASFTGHVAVVNRLLQDPRVRRSLTPHQLQNYIKRVSYIFPPD